MAVLSALAFLLGLTSAARADSWRYVLPPVGDPHEHPPLRVLALSSQKPKDLQETVRYRGQRQRYAQITYGSPRSTEVAIVLDEVSPTDVDLYVDADRNRIIETKDRVQGKDYTWRVPLDVAVVEGKETKFLRRAVIFRLGRTSRTLSFAACGYVEGTIQIGNDLVAARRVDADGNGFFADSQDRLWLDLNKDGRWDPVDEQFLYAPILRLGTTRYAVRGDALGNRLALEKLEGTGTVRIAVKQPELAERIEDVTVMLLGRDGSAVSLRGTTEEVVLPVGDYRLSILSLTLKDSQGSLPWNFVFSDNGGRPPHKWYKVDKGKSQTIDPIGKLELLPGLSAKAASCQPGKTLPIQPELFTGDGLLINTVYRGEEESRYGYGSCSALVELVTLEGRVIDSQTSGFA
jgi:hypothetical protein